MYVYISQVACIAGTRGKPYGVTVADTDCDPPISAIDISHVTGSCLCLVASPIAIRRYWRSAYRLARDLCLIYTAYLRSDPLTRSLEVVDWGCLPPDFKSWPHAMRFSLIRVFFPIFKVCLFSQRKKGASLYDNFFIWSSFSPIQVMLDSEWIGICNETISESSLWLSFSSNLQRICAIWHLSPLIWILLDLEVYPGSIFGSHNGLNNLFYKYITI